MGRGRCAECLMQPSAAAAVTAGWLCLALFSAPQPVPAGPWRGLLCESYQMCAELCNNSSFPQEPFSFRYPEH